LITPETGIGLKMGSRVEVVAQMREALEGLVDEPERAAAMGVAGRKRVLDHFTWDAKANQVASVYQRVLGRGVLGVHATEPSPRPAGVGTGAPS
jgi:glycosyltransferase involved in cell wall biosynthesis